MYKSTKAFQGTEFQQNQLNVSSCKCQGINFRMTNFGYKKLSGDGDKGVLPSSSFLANLRRVWMIFFIIHLFCTYIAINLPPDGILFIFIFFHFLSVSGSSIGAIPRAREKNAQITFPSL